MIPKEMERLEVSSRELTGSENLPRSALLGSKLPERERNALVRERGEGGNQRMKLSEAFMGTRVAGAERGSTEAWSIIHRSRSGFHLSRYSTVQGQQASHLWTFPNLYELLLFARAEGFAEVDPEAEDWQPVFRDS